MNLKRVIVMRGLSGSGKSTVAKKMIAGEPKAVIVSTDDYLMVDGEYRWAQGKLDDAHNGCFRAFMAAIEDEAPLIIVDNTNSRALEMAPYMMAGRAYGYDCRVLQIDCDPDIAAERTTHNTPKDAIIAMAARMKTEQLPPWWTVESLLV